jgi:hypothetical protein
MSVGTPIQCFEFHDVDASRGFEGSSLHKDATGLLLIFALAVVVVLLEGVATDVRELCTVQRGITEGRLSRHCIIVLFQVRVFCQAEEY